MLVQWILHLDSSIGDISCVLYAWCVDGATYITVWVTVFARRIKENDLMGGVWNVFHLSWRRTSFVVTSLQYE